MDAAKLALIYSTSSVQFIDLFFVQIPAGSATKDGKSAPDGCGWLIPMEGEARFQTKGGSFTLSPGVAFHAPPSVPMEKEVIGEQPWQYALLHYALPAHQREKCALYGDAFALKIGSSTRLVAILSELYRLHIRPGAIAALHTQALLMSVLSEIVTCAQRDQYRDSSMVEHAISFFQRHFAEQISISRLCQEYGMNRKQFSYLFKKHAGMSPNQYLIDHRMHKAREYLSQTGCSVAEVAAMVGYQDPFYFSRLFKKYTTVSPSAFPGSRDKSPG